MTQPVDLLVFGPHPDDIEISCGSLVATMVARGYRVGLVDLTRGETGTRGTPETRLDEAEAAANVLGASFRENLELPDGAISDEDPDTRRAVIEAIRRHRPTVVVGPYSTDYHPDHAATGRLLQRVLFLSGLAKIDADGTPWRAEQIWSYMCHDPFPPSFIVDVSAVFEQKLAAIRCFESQLYRADSDEPATNIASADYLERLEARFRYFGSLIRARYGEPFHTTTPVRMRDPLHAFASTGDDLDE